MTNEDRIKLLENLLDDLPEGVVHDDDLDRANEALHVLGEQATRPVEWILKLSIPRAAVAAEQFDLAGVEPGDVCYYICDIANVVPGVEISVLAAPGTKADGR